MVPVAVIKMGIQFLDCTLRDGAHVNGGNFGKEHIVNIIEGLTDSGVDIVEVGFLKNVTYDEDVTSYPKIEDAYSILSACHTEKRVRYAVMARADTYDISNLSRNNGTIGLVRVAFYYDYLDKAMIFAKQIKSLGYDFTLNLINTPGNSLSDLEKLIQYANDIEPYAVMIVDTFGVLDQTQLNSIATKYDRELKPSIRIGLHAHENLSQAFPMAQQFIETIGSRRDIIVDGSLMGMGRAPGNLCTELICNYLIEKHCKSYNINRILGTIAKNVKEIKDNFKWGYSPEYFISAKYRVHRSYAEYLAENNTDYDLIDRILSKIDAQHAEKFDESYLLSIKKEMEGD